VARPADAAIDGTKVGLSPGSVYTIDNLWHGLLMGSGNDTANALAALAGGMPIATGLMTRTARSLGALDTVVANTSGLDAKGQVSSVYDLAIIGRALLRDPGLAALVRTKTYRFPGTGKRLSHGARRTYQIQNHDLLLFRYPGATGIKNGYTTAAGASFVGSATRGGHSYVVALLRTDFESWRLGAALLDWAFAHGTRATPVGVLASAAALGEPPPAAGVPGPSSPGVGGGSGAGTPGSGAGKAPPSSRAGQAEAGSGVAPGVPSVVAAPVAAALRSVPARSRTNWLVAAFVVAVAGGAAVRALATRWPAGGGPGRSAAARRGRRPAPNRTSSARGRPARRGSR
jgi:D-alanyl-D-alanine carboxypeptidase (penicillin-binding protein 5/6)